MQRFALFMAVCAFVAASAAQASTPRGQGKPNITINFLEIQTSFGGTVSENEPPKPGDRFWFHSEFYKWKGATRGAHIGHVDTLGTFLGGASNLVQISAVAYLPGGTISVLGNAGNGRVLTLAVVGGTGAYATARGEVSIRNLGGPNSNMSADTVRLWT